MVQVGDYHLGVVPDMFVFGPEVVVYGDRSVYAELFDGVKDGAATYRLVRGRMSEGQLQRLLSDADALPPTSPVGLPGTDGFPLLLVTGARTWDINDLEAEPFATYLDEVRATVRSAATEAWRPPRWIVRPYGAPRCSAQQPSEQSYYDAPVYPHVLDQYSLESSTANRAAPNSRSGPRHEQL